MLPEKKITLELNIFSLTPSRSLKNSIPFFSFIRKFNFWYVKKKKKIKCDFQLEENKVDYLFEVKL